jgi:hypothetical protein
MSFELYSENLVDQSVLTVSSVNANFPAINIKDERRSKVYRSTTNDDTVVFDFGETSEVNTIFLISDKRNGFGFTSITAEFNATNTWGAPAASEVLTFSTEFGVGFNQFTTTHAYRFCRLVITSTLGYCELSNIFMGKKQEIGRSIG